MVLECGMLGCGGMGGGIDHSSLALLLIALGIGALVKYKAIKATSCQMFGKVVAYIIMIVATLGIICTLNCAYKARNCHTDKKPCHESDEGKDTEKPMGGMQLPAGHPDISHMKMPEQAPAQTK